MHAGDARLRMQLSNVTRARSLGGPAREQQLGVLVHEGASSLRVDWHLPDIPTAACSGALAVFACLTALSLLSRRRRETEQGRDGSTSAWLAQLLEEEGPGSSTEEHAPSVLRPSDAISLLYELHPSGMGPGNNVLVDIRGEDELQEAGLPRLRQGARYNATAVSLATIQLPASFLGEVGSREAIMQAWADATLRRLGELKERVQTITIMDSGCGGLATQLALVLTQRGYNAKVMEGGFSQWVQEGLPTERASGEPYQTSVGLLVADELEAVRARLASQVVSLCKRLSRPGVWQPLLLDVCFAALGLWAFSKALGFHHVCYEDERTWVYLAWLGAAMITSGVCTWFIAAVYVRLFNH